MNVVFDIFEPIFKSICLAFETLCTYLKRYGEIIFFSDTLPSTDTFMMESSGNWQWQVKSKLKSMFAREEAGQQTEIEWSLSESENKS